ncbi:EPIDERMAL PATTERNING FACTOR-like protein 2 isoform X2 [Andrographis paniculata]|uniref:EPIDERMAL PATTERNING FACTOR-like protein 2 isoform X2 n=1 Tax=Andrographis paniculata TaxID=175694 RepID=UPI0021E7F60C|nr:EPIDERMAL PATTERNING FACTOR-like protein 2 isoform X2 [Andrographis paniculata]
MHTHTVFSLLKLKIKASIHTYPKLHCPKIIHSILIIKTTYLPRNSMGCIKTSKSKQQLLIIALFLILLPLISTLSSFHMFSQATIFLYIFCPGRELSSRVSSDGTNLVRKNNQERVRLLVMGSRPPRCDESMCKNCGQCEAVQVPISPTQENDDQVMQPRDDLFAAAYDRGDDISNYKPMCWKCKCGDLIINP